MRKVIICDDNQEELEAVSNILKQFIETRGNRYETVSFHDQNAFLEYMRENKQDVQVLFVCMRFYVNTITENKSDSLDLIPGDSVILYSDLLEDAMNAYKYSHVYFVYRDKLEERLVDIYETHMCALQENTVFVFNQKGQRLIFRTKDILYVERDRRCCHIVTANNRIKINLYFEELSEQLRKDLFLRCHNSYIVNVSAVEQMMADAICMRGGATIPISRKYKKDAQQSVERWQNMLLHK